jgi:hypothetical protein
VHSNNASRPLNPGEDVVNVDLKKGWNDLMLKVTNGGSDWAACARIRAADGNKLEGIRAEIGQIQAASN